MDDLRGLLNLPNLSTLDISDNKIRDEGIVLEILSKIPNLGVLYLSGNDVCKYIKNYRKFIIYECKNLKYLDDKPVFPEERRFAVAFFKYLYYLLPTPPHPHPSTPYPNSNITYRGGSEAEMEERKKYK